MIHAHMNTTEIVAAARRGHGNTVTIILLLRERRN